jgi:hypothetical protein
VRKDNDQGALAKTEKTNGLRVPAKITRVPILYVYDKTNDENDWPELSPLPSLCSEGRETTPMFPSSLPRSRVLLAEILKKP